MAVYIERTTIGYHMFIYQDDVRRCTHKILQLKSKINLTRLLLRKNARSCNNTTEDQLSTFNRAVQYALHLEKQLAIANFNELKPKANYFAEQVEAKLKLLQQNETEKSARKIQNTTEVKNSERTNKAKHNEAFLVEKSPNQWWIQPQQPNKSRLQRSELKIQLFKNANERWSLAPKQQSSQISQQRLVGASSVRRLQLKVQLENWPRNVDENKDGKRRLDFYEQPQSAAKKTRRIDWI